MRFLSCLPHRLLAVLWVCLCLAVLPVQARTPATPVPIQLTIADGLPSDTINQLAEDKQGYLWLASDDGLARFDGRNYRIWRMEDGLTSNVVWTICVDADDRVWMGFEDGGVGYLEANTRTFKRLEDPQFPELRDATLWSLAQTPNGDIWIGTAKQGLYRYRPDGRMQHFSAKAGDAASLPSDNIVGLEVAPDGGLWIGTWGGLVHWDGRRLERVPLPGPSQSVNRMYKEPDGKVLWIADFDGNPVRFNTVGRPTARPWQSGTDTAQVRGVLLRDRLGRYWLDTATGLGMSTGDGGVERVPVYSFSAHGLVNRNWITAYRTAKGVCGLPAWRAGCGTCLRAGIPSRCFRIAQTIRNRSPTPRSLRRRPRSRAGSGWSAPVEPLSISIPSPAASSHAWPRSIQNAFPIPSSKAGGERSGLACRKGWFDTTRRQARSGVGHCSGTRSPQPISKMSAGLAGWPKMRKAASGWRCSRTGCSCGAARASCSGRSTMEAMG